MGGGSLEKVGTELGFHRNVDEIVTKHAAEYLFVEERPKMLLPRVGHVSCNVGNSFIFATGNMILDGNLPHSGEMYIVE